MTTIMLNVDGVTVYGGPLDEGDGVSTTTFVWEMEFEANVDICVR